MSRIFLFKRRAHLKYIFVETETCFVAIIFINVTHVNPWIKVDDTAM